MSIKILILICFVKNYLKKKLIFIIHFFIVSYEMILHIRINNFINNFIKQVNP